MNGTRSYGFDCLRLPNVHLPKEGLAFNTFLLQLLATQFFIITFHLFFFGPLHLPPIVTQMFAGVFLCPTTPWAKNEIYEVFHTVLFPIPTKNVDETLAMLAYIIYSFLIAVKMDFSIVIKTGRKAFFIGIFDVLIPIFLDLALMSYLYPDFLRKLRGKNPDAAEFYINLTTLPLTHFPNVATFLLDMKMINSELGRLALSSSLIGHILSMFLLLIANVITRPVSHPILLVTPFILLLVSIFIIRPIFKWMVKRTPKGRPMNQMFVCSGVMIMFFGALATQYSGQLFLLGAFIVGAVVPDGPPFGSAIVEKLEFFVVTLLLPFFVITSVMGTDYRALISGARVTYLHLALAVLAYLAKFMNSLVCGLYSRMAFDDALALSFIMSIKGIVDIGALIIFREAEVLSTPNYTIMMFWTMFIATITPLFVRSLYHPLKKYAGYQRRDILHCKYNSELRILLCFMRSHRVNPLARLINSCCPSETNTLVVYALHLVKLVGRAHPIFIAHDMQTRKDSANVSEDVIWAFYKFQQMCRDYLTLHIFTAVSPFEAFHEDACTLALDKLASVIVVPFHIRFRIDGSFDFADIEQKAVNHELLSGSPCSVAVLVDRGHFGHYDTVNTVTDSGSSSGSPLLVAVIYLGGLDDQEALAFAKRMGRDSRVRVHVIRLVAFGQARDLDALDSSALAEIQRSVLYNQQFMYTEKAVKDGIDTANFLKSAVDSYDLILVGRHYNFACSQLMGLKDIIAEETELGAIGDFLASQDLECKTSVLVVQQQKQWNS